MNGIYNPIVFYPAAIVMIAFALLAIYFKNIFYSLLSAIAVFFIAGMFFYVLGSEYNAIIQIAIYGVAVPVILGLTVMFTNHKKSEATNINDKKNTFITILTSGIFALALFYLIKISLTINTIGFNIVELSKNSSIQVINVFANALFVRYVFAFEIISLILTIIIIGITLLDQKEDKCKK